HADWLTFHDVNDHHLAFDHSHGAISANIVASATDTGHTLRGLHFIFGSGGQLLYVAENAPAAEVELGFDDFFGTEIVHSQAINAHGGVFGHPNHRPVFPKEKIYDGTG